jgi:hypothetical protein
MVFLTTFKCCYTETWNNAKKANIRSLGRNYLGYGFLGGAGGAFGAAGGRGGTFGADTPPGWPGGGGIFMPDDCPGGGGALGALKPQLAHCSLVTGFIAPHLGQAASGTNPQFRQTASGSLAAPHCGQGSVTFCAVGGRKHMALFSLSF